MSDAENVADVIIIGAGACGLIAARELVRQKKKVILLEGRNRIGGRIYSFPNEHSSNPVEAGAEFIHGNLPLTLSLLKEYDVAYQAMEGVFWQTKTGDVDKDANFIEDHQQTLAKHLKELKTDITVEQFLNTYFQDEKYNLLKEEVRGFVHGYDAADPSRASTFAFREEWMGEFETQYRIPQGYGHLLGKVADEIIQHGCRLHLSEIVKHIEWDRNKVKVITQDAKEFFAEKVIVTVPSGILTSHLSTATIQFSPSISDKIKMVEKLGYGSVIKFIFFFKRAFWRDENIKRMAGKDLHNLGFVFSDATVPTWWTQFPNPSSQLTGWLGGLPALALSQKDEKTIAEVAIQSLAAIFSLTENELREILVDFKIFDWGNDPFSLGAYSYTVVDETALKKYIHEPVDDTLFFAGEGFHSGENSGTVEAAFNDGFRVARAITKS